MNSTYTIGATEMFVTDGDGPRTAWVLHDLPRNPDHWRTEALVASGDFCEMLAITLEQVSTALPAASVEQYQLQDVIGHLLYTQRHYKLVKRTPRSYRGPSQLPNQPD